MGLIKKKISIHVIIFDSLELFFLFRFMLSFFDLLIKYFFALQTIIKILVARGLRHYLKACGAAFKSSFKSLWRDFKLYLNVYGHLNSKLFFNSTIYF